MRFTLATVLCLGVSGSYAQPLPSPQEAQATPRLHVTQAMIEQWTGDGWYPAVDDKGQAVLERRTRLGKKSVWVTGLATFVAMPLLTGVGLAIDGRAEDKTFMGGISLVPVVGMFVNAWWVTQASYGGACADSCSGVYNPGRLAGWTIAGATQATGLVMLIVGLGIGPEKIERVPFRIGATPTQGGGQLSAIGQF